MNFQAQENDQPGENSRSNEEIAAELRRIANLLDQPTQAVGSKGTREQGRSSAMSPAGTPQVDTDYLLRVRAILAARKERDLCFGAEYFAEPAWDILLDLFEARLTGQARSIKSVGHAARVPLTTALRHIDRLIDGGLVEKTNDPGDGRRSLLSLTPASQRMMMRFLDKFG